MALHFPAFCPNCGLIFGSGIAAGDVTRLTISNVRQNCPRCGAWADLPDGTFDVVGDTIRVVAGSGLTRARLRALASILDSLNSGAMTDEAAVEAMRREAPALAPLIDRLQPRMRKAFFFFLSSLIGALISQGVNQLTGSDASRADVQHAVEQALEYCVAHRP